MPQARNVNLMRDPAATGRVTNIELFFDLAYVFAVTQLSHYLLAHPTLTGALRAGLLLIMVWLPWVYTTWVTNWLDPERLAVRLMLLGLAGASLVMSAALPGALGARGVAVGAAYVTMPSWTTRATVGCPEKPRTERPRHQRPRRKTRHLPLPVLPLPEAT